MNISIPADLCLNGRYVDLEPLTLEHTSQLLRVAADGELWQQEFTGIPDPDAMDGYLADALEAKSKGKQHPFVVRRKSDGQLVGCTRFYGIKAKDRYLSIGFTWYAKSVHRTAVNTETKFLLLNYAFEKLDCIGVAFHTDHKNKVSQAAILRLGATKEGILRNTHIMPSGRVSHTWCFSITDSEWPDVKANLKNRLTGLYT